MDLGDVYLFSITNSTLIGQYNPEANIDSFRF